MKKTGAKILVNAITMTRVIGTFLMPFISVNYNAEELVAFVIVLLITDQIDGMLARRLKCCTLFGALLDTLADKLLAIATLIILARAYPIMWLPLLLEIIITLVNVSSGNKGATVESSILGKVKTWILGICTVFGYIILFAKDFINLFDNDNTIGIFLINTFKYISNHNKVLMIITSLIATTACLIVAITYFLKHHKEIITNQKNGFYRQKYKLKKGAELKEALFSTEFYERTKHESILIRLGREV